MFRLLGFLFVLCVVGQPSFGDDNHKVLGTWKLVSYETEVQATGEKEPAMGQNPTGYVVFNAEGRVFLVLTGDPRKPAKDQPGTCRTICHTHRLYGHLSR